MRLCDRYSNDVLIWIANSCFIFFVDLALHVVDESNALVVIRLLLCLNNLLIHLTYNSDQQVQHDDCDEGGRQNVEELEHYGSSKLVVINVVLT